MGRRREREQPRVRLLVVRSSSRAGQLSLRSRTGEGLADLYRALEAGGFKPGDRVSLVLDEEASPPPAPAPAAAPPPGGTGGCTCAQPNVDLDGEHKQILAMEGDCPRHRGVIAALRRLWRSCGGDE